MLPRDLCHHFIIAMQQSTSQVDVRDVMPGIPRLALMFDNGWKIVAFGSEDEALRKSHGIVAFAPSPIK